MDVIYDTHRFVVQKYELSVDKLKSPFHFVVLADLHGKSFGKGNEKLLRSIDEIKPEAILIAGDMMTAHKGYSYDEAVDLILKLADKYPIYYGSGNHEYRMAIYPEVYGDMSKDYEEKIAHENVTRLHNDVAMYRDDLCIAGIEIEREYYKKWNVPTMPDDYVQTLLADNDAQMDENNPYRILIAHNPQYFDTYAKSNADLVLSGHVHGGIAKLPLLGGVISPALRLFPKYDGGLFQSGTSTMILSRGLGCHTIPVRFLNPGELVEVVLTPQDMV